MLQNGIYYKQMTRGDVSQMVSNIPYSMQLFSYKLVVVGQSSHFASGYEISWMRKTTWVGVPITNHRENTDRYLPPVLMSVITGQQASD